MLKNRGVRSVCALPLTTVHRRLGGLAVGSTEADAYSKEEVSFLSIVANQVALAVDDALNFDASQHAKESLRASEESFRLIVDSIPGLVLTMTAEGELEFVSQQGLDYSGMRYAMPNNRGRTLTKTESPSSSAVVSTRRSDCMSTKVF